MTFLQAKTRLHIGVQRDDLVSSEGDSINEAVREIAKARNWAFMKTTADVVILANTDSVALPAAFKEFNTTKTPVHEQIDDQLVPVTLWHREQAIRRWSVLPTPLTSILWFDYKDGAAYLYAPETSDTDRTFTVSYFGHFAALSGDSDTNQLLTDWPDMVVQRAKAILLSAINDDESEKAMERFSAAYRIATHADALAQLAGITLKM
jgi:hypothetical protein